MTVGAASSDVKAVDLVYSILVSTRLRLVGGSSS